MNNIIDTNCQTIQANVQEQIVNMSLEKAEQSRAEFESDWYADDHLYLTLAERKLLNEWLNNFDLPEIDYAVLFQKKCLPELKNNNIHIDYNDALGVLSKAVVNFPIMNCLDTKMTWWSGNYSWTKKYASKRAETSLEKTQNCSIPFADLHWHSEPELAEIYNIGDKVFLAKVDTPHSVTAGNQFRIVLSLRLQGNPDFQTLKNTYLKSIYDI